MLWVKDQVSVSSCFILLFLYFFFALVMGWMDLNLMSSIAFFFLLFFCDDGFASKR